MYYIYIYIYVYIIYVVYMYVDIYIYIYIYILFAIWRILSSISLLTLLVCSWKKALSAPFLWHQLEIQLSTQSKIQFSAPSKFIDLTSLYLGLF